MTKTSSPSSQSTSARRKRADDLTVVLFKDHYVPRTLKVPSSWIPQLGLTLSLGGLGLVVAMLVAAQGWFLAWKAQPQRLRTLEDQIENLRRTNDALETELRALRRGEPTAPILGMREGNPSEADVSASAGSVDTAAAESTETQEPSWFSMIFGSRRENTAPAEVSEDPFGLDLSKSESPTPGASAPPAGAPTSEVASASPNPSGSDSSDLNTPPASSASATLAAQGIPFLLPEATEGGVPAPGSLPFRLTPVQMEWSDNALNLKFALQYTSEDGGNQQGRIVLLGRAADRFAAYPEAALSTSSFPRTPLAQAPLSPERGEFFSVSRYREVIGQLRLPADARRDFSDVWVLIFNTRGKLLLSQNLSVNAQRNSTPAPTAPPSTVAPTPASSPAKTEKVPPPDISR